MRIFVISLFILEFAHFSQGEDRQSVYLGQNNNRSIVGTTLGANVTSEDAILNNIQELPVSSPLIPDKIESDSNVYSDAKSFADDIDQKAKKEIQQADLSKLDESERANRRSNIELTEITAYDWETGEDLMEGLLKNKQLFVRKANGLLTFNAQKEGTTSPVHLRFEGMSPDTCNSKWHHLTLKICLAKKKVCKDGCAICYVGKMDPANRPTLLDFYQVPNLAETDYPDLCKQENLKGWENKTVHAIYIKTNDAGNIEMTTSFSKGANEKGDKFEMKPDADNCVLLQIGSESEPICTVMDANHQNRREKDMESVWMFLANNGDLADLHFMNILPFDVFADFHENEPLLAFASSKDCGMEISVDGPLKRCISQKCDKLVGYEQFMTPGQKKKALYKNEFKHMKPILLQSDVPAEYKNNVMFRNVDNHKQAVITTMGEEVVFAVVTEKSDPPILSFIRPDDSFYCTEPKNFDINELVLAFNGRPDCFGMFALGERKMRYRNNFLETKVLGKIDFPIIFKEYTIWTVNQLDSPEALGRSNCVIEGEKYNNPRGVKDIPEGAYIWKFILNPKRSHESTPIIQGSRCRLGVGINLDADYLVLTDFSDLYQELHGDDEQSTTTEENPPAE